MDYDPMEIRYKKVSRRNNSDIKEIQYLSLNDDGDNWYVIWYNSSELGWAIGHFEGVNNTSTPSNDPEFITDQDPSAFRKCPHDSSLKWRRNYHCLLYTSPSPRD